MDFQIKFDTLNHIIFWQFLSFVIISLAPVATSVKTLLSKCLEQMSVGVSSQAKPWRRNLGGKRFHDENTLWLLPKHQGIALKIYIKFQLLFPRNLPFLSQIQFELFEMWFKNNRRRGRFSLNNDLNIDPFHTKLSYGFGPVLFISVKVYFIQVSKIILLRF